jgi:hypothetical protein
VFVDVSPQGYFSMGLSLRNREKLKFVFLPMNQCFSKTNFGTPSERAHQTPVRRQPHLTLN